MTWTSVTLDFFYLLEGESDQTNGSLCSHQVVVEVDEALDYPDGLGAGTQAIVEDPYLESKSIS